MHFEKKRALRLSARKCRISPKRKIIKTKKLTILFLGFLMAVSFSVSAADSEAKLTIMGLEGRIDALEKRVVALEKHLMETEIETESNQGTKRVENVNTDRLTMRQKNALDSANNYLETMPFSYEGLID